MFKSCKALKGIELFTASEHNSDVNLYLAVCKSRNSFPGTLLGRTELSSRLSCQTVNSSRGKQVRMFLVYIAFTLLVTATPFLPVLILGVESDRSRHCRCHQWTRPRASLCSGKSTAGHFSVQAIAGQWGSTLQGQNSDKSSSAFPHDALSTASFEALYLSTHKFME